MTEVNLKYLKLTSIFTGLVGLTNTILLGIHITNHCLILASLVNKFFKYVIYTEVITTISLALIILGCYSIYKNYFFIGGVSNLIAGIITVGMYLHYTFNLTILQKFGIFGYFLLLPTPISGIMGIATSRIALTKN